VLVEQVEEDPQKSKRLTTKELVMENIDYMLDIYLIYILTLSIFPTFLSEDTEAHNLESWYFFAFLYSKIPQVPCINRPTLE
jgi:hypothetical protein